MKCVCKETPPDVRSKQKKKERPEEEACNPEAQRTNFFKILWVFFFIYKNLILSIFQLMVWRIWNVISFFLQPLGLLMQYLCNKCCKASIQPSEERNLPATQKELIPSRLINTAVLHNLVSKRLEEPSLLWSVIWLPYLHRFMVAIRFLFVCFCIFTK